MTFLYFDSSFPSCHNLQSWFLTQVLELNFDPLHNLILIHVVQVLVLLPLLNSNQIIRKKITKLSTLPDFFEDIKFFLEKLNLLVGGGSISDIGGLIQILEQNSSLEDVSKFLLIIDTLEIVLEGFAISLVVENSASSVSCLVSSKRLYN